jgi:hypothetical protein
MYLVQQGLYVHLTADTNGLMNGIDEFLASEMRDSLTVKLVGQTGIVSQASYRVGNICFSVSSAQIVDYEIGYRLTWQLGYLYLHSNSLRQPTCLDPSPSNPQA